MKKPARRIRVPKPVLAMASPPAEHPVVTVDRLKSGEYNFSVRVPARSVKLARERAITEARLLMLQCQELEAEEKRYRKANLETFPTAVGK